MGNLGLAAAETSIAMDYGSTMEASRDGWSHFQETNLVMGKDPSQVAISSYMATSALATALIWYKLPRWARPLWSLGVISLEGWCIEENERAGVGLL